MQGGPPFIPPELLMSMMNDLTRGGVGGDIPNFQYSGPPPRGPASAPGGIGVGG